MLVWDHTGQCRRKMEIKCGSYGAKLIETNLWRFPETTEKNAMTRSKNEYPLVICSIVRKTAHLQFSVASALSANKQMNTNHFYPIDNGEIP